MEDPHHLVHLCKHLRLWRCLGIQYRLIGLKKGTTKWRFIPFLITPYKITYVGWYGEPFCNPSTPEAEAGKTLTMY